MTQSTSTSAKQLTFEEFLAYEEDSDMRYELVNGELVEMPTESSENCQIAKRLMFELAKHVPIALLNLKDYDRIKAIENCHTTKAN